MNAELSRFENYLNSRSYWRAMGGLVFALCVLLAAIFLMQRPYFDWRRVTIQGEVSRLSLQAIKNQTLVGFDGNFWSLSLRPMQKRLEATPWVRRAVIHRQFPDTLRVQIEEHVPAALWQSESSSAFVNGFGEVFEAEAADLVDDLPVFKGQEEQSPRLMNMYVALNRIVNQQGVQIHEIALSRGGAWSLGLSTGAHLELGRGSDRELQLRLQRFFPTLSEIFPEKSAKEALLMIASADLRYQNGFSVRLRSAAEGNRVE